MKAKLILGKISLGEILSNREMSHLIEKPFRKMLGILFGSDELNIRNSLTHCRYESFNYHSWAVTIVLYDLVAMMKVDFAFISDRPRNLSPKLRKMTSRSLGSLIRIN